MNKIYFNNNNNNDNVCIMITVGLTNKLISLYECVILIPSEDNTNLQINFIYDI